MKQKQGAFANSATGYGKKHNSKAHKTNNNNKFAKSGEPRQPRENHKKLKYADKEPDKPEAEDPDNELNSGFGNYLRSSEGLEMMKIFVFANTLMVVVTVAWPQLKEQYIYFMEWLHGYKDEPYQIQ